MNNIGMLKSTQAEVLASEDALHWVGFAGLQMHVWFFNLSPSGLFRRLLLAAASAAAVRTGFRSFLSTGEANTYTPRRVWLTAADITRCHHSQVGRVRRGRRVVTQIAFLMTLDPAHCFHPKRFDLNPPNSVIQFLMRETRSLIFGNICADLHIETNVSDELGLINPSKINETISSNATVVKGNHACR